MINLTGSKIRISGAEEDIESWAVWFQTPFGITPDIKFAVERCQQAELDPEINIIPVPIAIGRAGEYEIYFPRR